MHYLTVVLAILVASVTGAPGTGRLVGGSQAAAAQFPFVVSVSENDLHICGGFIYNDRWVVTAASCIAGRYKENVKVTIGALSLITPDPEEQIITVFSNVTYSGYDPTTKLHDIALIELSRPIVFGTNAQAIRYDEIDESMLGTDPTKPLESYIVGWGATIDGGLPATRLRYGPISSLSADCRSYGIDEYIQNYMICAGGGPENVVAPCDFDEGSPLTQMANYNNVPELIVVGIMSKNLGCGDTTVPSIYTRLAAYYSWLLQTAGQQPANIAGR